MILKGFHWNLSILFKRNALENSNIQNETKAKQIPEIYFKDILYLKLMYPGFQIRHYRDAIHKHGVTSIPIMIGSIFERLRLLTNFI